jgi:acyl-CoA dehydrogenase
MDFELSEELKMIQSLTRDFVNERLKPLERDVMGRAADLRDAHAFLSAETEAGLVRMVRDMGLWGLGVPEEFGGAGLSTLGVCLVEEELAQTVIPFNFGDVTPLLFDSNAEQRAKFLLPAIDRQKLPYLALMEPGRGAALSDMETKAERVNGHYILNGRKVSLSRTGDDYFAVVFAATGPAGGVSCFLVDKETPGFAVTGGEETTGWMSGLREPIFLSFDNCRVSAENILGEEGKAFHLGERWLPQRRVVRGARCVGIARRLLDEVTVQARSWQSFGRPINERTSIQAALTDIGTLIHAGRLMVHEAAWKADKGDSIRREAAMVKLYATQIIHTVADRAAHVFNGPPFIAGLPMERLCRHALANSAIELALELQRSVIARDIIKGLRV